jgi:hypothetical protein
MADRAHGFHSSREAAEPAAAEVLQVEQAGAIIAIYLDAQTPETE